MPNFKSLIISALGSSLPSNINPENDIIQAEVVGENLFMALDEFFVVKVYKTGLYKDHEDLNRYLLAAYKNLEIETESEEDDEEANKEEKVAQSKKEAAIDVLPVGKKYQICHDHLNLIYLLSDATSLEEVDEVIFKYKNFLMANFQMTPEDLKKELVDVVEDVLVETKSEMKGVLRQDKKELNKFVKEKAEVNSKNSEVSGGKEDRSNVISLAEWRHRNK